MHLASKFVVKRGPVGNVRTNSPKVKCAISLLLTEPRDFEEEGD